MARPGVFLVVLGVVSCDLYPTESFPRSEDLRREDVITLERIGEASPIDIRRGDIATLVARIPGESNTPVVTFTTSAGFFVITGTREARIRAIADSTDPRKRLAARITLRADTSAFAVVSAVVADYRDTVRVAFARSSP